MPPPNSDAATATLISALPFTVSGVTVHEAGTTYNLWYAYTPTADTMIGAFACGGVLNTGYEPYTEIYGPDDPATYYVGGGKNRAVQAWLTHDATYYIKVATDSITVTPAVASLSVLAFSATTYAVGDLLVPDDSPGFPLVILSATSATPISYVQPFPAGEAGAVLDDGTLMVADETGGAKIFYADLSLRVSLPTLPTPETAGITSNKVNAFYSADFDEGSGTCKVWKISQSGAITGPVVTMTLGASFGPIAVSPDETILYYRTLTATDTEKIFTHSLLTNTTLGLFADAVPGYSLARRELLCLKDGSVVAAYFVTGGADRSDYFIRRYQSDGTVANTYVHPGDLSINTDFIRLAHAVDDPASFWVWYEQWETAPASGTTGLGIFLHINASDGTILHSGSSQQFSMGGAEGPQQLDPIRFGHSQSCPFLIVRVGGPATPPPGNGNGGDHTQPPYVAPSYHLDARYIRRLRRAPHVANENTRMCYRRFELDLERGVGLATGQGEEPLVMLRLSRDGGHTWGEPQLMSAGRLGAYSQRVIARRLGQARDTVFEVTVSDPVAWSLVQAWLDLEPGTN